MHLKTKANAAKQRHLARWASLQLLLGFGVVLGVSMPTVTIMTLFLGFASWVQYPRRMVDSEITIENGVLTAKTQDTIRVPLKNVVALQWSASRVELWVHRGEHIESHRFHSGAEVIAESVLLSPEVKWPAPLQDHDVVAGARRFVSLQSQG